MECSLSFCGQKYNTSIKLGQTNTTEVQRWGRLNTTVTVEGGNLLDQTWPLVGDNTTFGIAATYSSSLQLQLSSLLTGYRFTSFGTQHDYSSTIAQIFSDALQNTSLVNNPNSPDDVEIISQLLEGLAISLTNKYETLSLKYYK